MAKEVSVRISATDSFSDVFTRYQSAIRGAASETDRLGTASKTSTSAVSDIAGAMRTAMAVWGTLQIGQFVGDIINMGQQANTTEAVFKTLTGTLGGYEGVLNRIRTATNNIVDDQTLQEGANRMMQMGIAKTPEELERLMEMAVKLGGSLGMDPTKALSDFSLMLANNSIMRLDQFGISAGQVRARMAELKTEIEGIDRSTAFQMAVLEIGAESLERLGSAADAAATPLARLGTALTNFGQDFAQRAATGANSLIGIAEIALGQSPMQQGIRMAAEANATAYLDTFKNALSGTDMAGMGNIIGDEGLSSALADAFERVSLSPGASMADLFGNEQSRDGVTRAIVETLTAAQAAAVQLQQQTPVDFMSAALSAGAPGSQIQNIIAAGFQPTQAFINAREEIRNAHGALAQFTGVYTDLTSLPSLSELMRPEDADVITQMFENATTDLESLKELNQQNLISDFQLQQAQDMTDRLGSMSDQAQAAAQAFENLSLSQALGQTEGGMAGEITDMVEKYLKDTGRGEEVPAFLQAMGLQTGRETTSSLMLQNILVPLLAQMSGAQAGGAAVNIQDFLQNAALMNYSQENITSFLPMFMQRGFTGEQNKWDAYTKMYGGVGEKGEGAGMEDAITTTEQIAGNMSTAAEQGEALTAAIEAIPDSKAVKITLTADDPQGILKLLAAGSVETQVRNNGGSVPGSRTGTGGRGQRGGR